MLLFAIPIDSCGTAALGCGSPSFTADLLGSEPRNDTGGTSCPEIPPAHAVTQPRAAVPQKEQVLRDKQPTDHSQLPPAHDPNHRALALPNELWPTDLSISVDLRD